MILELNYITGCILGAIITYILLNIIDIIDKK